MKVQKVVRAQGEYAKVGQDLKDQTLIKILDEGQVVTGDFGDRHVFKVTTLNGEKNLSFNQTSMNNLIEEFGDDTTNWMNKEVKVFLITQSVSGQMKKVCYLTGPDWEMVEDAKGNLKFAKLDQVETVDDLNAQLAHKAKDLPF